MSRKALKVLVEIKFRAVSCPGVHLPAKDDIYLSMCFMGQYRQSECLPAVFPLLFHEKMTFEKIFRYAVDPGDIAVMLEYETVTVELVQLIPPGGGTLACFEEDARRFLFPEPKLVPSFSGVDREVLMTRAPHFPGIAPRLEFSTKTTIMECPADADINIYPNVPMRPAMRRNRKPSSRPRSSSPQKKQPHSLGRRPDGRGCSARSPSYTPRPRSLSPLRAGDAQRLQWLSLDSAAPDPAPWNTTGTSQPLLASWPGASRSASPHRSAVFTNSSSPMTSSSSVRYSLPGRRKSISNGLVGGMSEDSSSSEAHDPLDYHQGHDPSELWRSYREQARHSRCHSSSHREWEEVQERVRGLLTTPRAVRRLVYGATHSEVDEVLARRSISPGPP
ncbi:LOW QUALITY PROTEIN: spermatogenesis associated 6-like protein [Plectropomus leopardus]|uniref:LOW QUALITY PROTEIN: spermatogenesis associated 6-like protein n=1 Tax=Plectropomus leopardus TaxID=160734 RepID=UPI001C4BC02E|nr:LOW QUALITY PROTEIN: spermatogenesis associated 6-like protein [Plectropomus leopardus]